MLRLSPRDIHQRVIASLVQVPYADIRIKTDVTAAQRDYMEERKDQFPGVRVEQTYLRSYPNRSLAAQLIGTIGEISDRQLGEKRFKGVAQDWPLGSALVFVLLAIVILIFAATNRALRAVSRL